mmetsp:Transcript_16678/g.53283  ORF Transcript_16678/g.53283 Transcript_16678/m.53283 type:complete len:292 (+) Transcript_16678:649-1524(+)
MRARSSLWYDASRCRWQQYGRSLSMKMGPSIRQEHSEQSTQLAPSESALAGAEPRQTAAASQGPALEGRGGARCGSGAVRDGGGGSERAVPAAFAVLDVSSLALPPQPSSPPGAVCAVSAAGGSARVGSLGGAGLVSASWREEVAVALSKASISRAFAPPALRVPPSPPLEEEEEEPPPGLPEPLSILDACRLVAARERSEPPRLGPRPRPPSEALRCSSSLALPDLSIHLVSSERSLPCDDVFLSTMPSRRLCQKFCWVVPPCETTCRSACRSVSDPVELPPRPMGGAPR